MPATSELDVGRRSSNIGAAGGTWTRQFHTTDIDATALAAAMDEIYQSLPAVGAQGPAGMTAYYLADKVIEDVTPDPASGKLRAMGQLIYATPTRSIRAPSSSGPTVSRTSSAGIVQTSTDRDVAGVQIATFYDNVAQVHELDTFDVVTSFSRGRPLDVDPLTIAPTYSGKLNLLLWNGFAALTVLCTGIDGDEREDAIGVWDAFYQFQYRAGGWQERATHEDPLYPGHPLPESEWGPTSSILVDVIPAVDFAGLGLTF